MLTISVSEVMALPLSRTPELSSLLKVPKMLDLLSSILTCFISIRQQLSVRIGSSYLRLNLAVATTFLFRIVAWKPEMLSTNAASSPSCTWFVKNYNFFDALNTQQIVSSLSFSNTSMQLKPLMSLTTLSSKQVFLPLVTLKRIYLRDGDMEWASLRAARKGGRSLLCRKYSKLPKEMVPAVESLNSQLLRMFILSVRRDLKLGSWLQGHECLLRFSTNFMMESPTKRLSHTQRLSTIASSLPSPQLQRLLQERQLKEERLLKQLSFKDESFKLFQNDHQLKMDQFQLQVNEEILKIKMKYAREIDQLKSVIIDLEGDLKEASMREQEDTLNIQALSLKLNEVEKELDRAHQCIQEKESLIGKMAAERKEIMGKLDVCEQKNESMKEQVVLLLHVEKEKEVEIVKLKENQLRLREKVQTLASAFNQIELHLRSFAQKLGSKDAECNELRLLLNRQNVEIVQKMEAIQRLEFQVQDAVRREKIREGEVKELLKENQKLYTQFTSAKHKLHDIAITYNMSP